jgi:putative ABC transport system permease protein
MFQNHLTIAFRNLLKRKGYSLLNILGLAIGITCCLLIFQYVAYEKSYDQFGPEAKRIYRLRLDSYQKGKLAWQSATSYPAIAPTMKRDFPEVEEFCRLYDANLLLSNDEKNVKFNELKGYYADPSVINMFDVHLLKGNPKTALDAPDKMILSQTMARKYFGNEEPLGKRLTSKSGRPRQFEVTGVFRDYPANSHLILNHLVSYSTLNQEMRERGDTSNAAETAWGWYDFYTYLLLKPGTDPKQLEEKLPAFSDKYMNSKEWAKANNIKAELYSIPMPDIHLYSNYNQEAEVNGDGKGVSFLFMISFFIIVIAWVNYSNMATARSLERAREVGVRKVLGAVRGDLITQFLTESLLLNLFAFIIGVLAAYLLTPSFNQLIGSTNDEKFSLPFNYLLIFSGLFLLGTLVSGLYPAFILSGYHPVTVLKGLFKNTTKGLVLRKSLIIGQFATSIILIAGTLIVYQQVRFMRNQQLGVNINQTLVLQGAQTIQDSVYQNVFQPFKTDLLKMSQVKNVTASSNVMGQEIYWTRGMNRLGEQGQAVTMYIMGIDYDFLPSYELKLLAGRNFSKDFKTDSSGILLNEKAIELFGFKNAQDAVGKKIRSRDTLTVVGVVTNYHHQGLQKAMDPMLFYLIPNINNYYSIKLSSSDMHQTMSTIERTWNKYFPADPFNYFFLDDSYNNQYKADTRFGEVFGLFAGLAIIIACFGLLGLSAYNVLQRTKEIGIRKVLGASVNSLLILLSKEFFLLVIVSLFVAIPVTWLVMNNWLQDFAYRINIQWWVFGLAGLIAILIAMLTTGLQALKASVANPVKSLRTE